MKPDWESIRRAIIDGKPAVLVDNRREFEADLVYPAELANSEVVNFMLSMKGLLCLTIDLEQALKRGFFPLPSKGGETNFLIPVDYEETFTGITAEERALTARKIAEGLEVEHFRYPGHLHLLGGVGLNWRRGHTESSLELMEILGFKRYALIVEILNGEGDSHDHDYVLKFAKEHDLPVLTTDDVWREFVRRKQLVSVYANARLPTRYGEFRIISFENELDFKEHVAIVKEPYSEVPLVRIHSKCLTGDTLASLKCDCGSQLSNVLRMIAQEGGILLYMDQEGRGIGLKEKIKAYELQDKGLDTVQANEALGHKGDERTYEAAFQMLRALGVSKVRLITNNPNKARALEELGIEVVEMIPAPGKVTEHNRPYLRIKAEKLGHKLPFEV
ncbi:bifunctional 3,4-dihydroxy-2-butanone-4-phosphate synthase/GTP cyclohydrolase II [Thermococcus sp. GR7]|uniref:bifunctional 3,4-dihydroxy-2-butanone-4-phosphate synthase/GTP cyclohydrolase II n=1 Tax=unclassified Thermococcus TaxID=2627626 RepID=UPI001431F742|nr:MULTISPECIES: bifunctional 3,4-dihydroxy-2-butanone-4-phosphate synthase/GTP cyclohydrolase II [unclassified Thermococcus]NJE46592.1 bifunctional 3,4-dihydroxy-2-butanone-4-phosphate synthase/GTP cyclohydrolase II [Thermococcus sp. GR7]NJE79055.1 bifunctional 3,4-dihydroxy-2-butanone-4-phosphate synthase/GTP cyclohydrolase II [Thermococcus sp. GR4]NJF23577.1 bifunctional 3,4-dihydroxy-2-butanone-4-phosphate synthase/GTP cyclohydrolase II [Thermococcus sp. GR5]